MGHCRLESFIHCSKNRYLCHMYTYVYIVQAFVLIVTIVYAINAAIENALNNQ